MPRLRLQYAKDEIITDQYTYGNELMYEDTIQYIGPYHRYTTGETYTGPIWDESTSKKLVEYQDTTSLLYRYKQLNTIRINSNSFTNYLVELKYNDYIIGHIDRYFIKKLNDGVITEISKLTYDEYNGSKIDQNLYKVINVKWVIAGPPETIIINGITKIGVDEQNRSTLITAERKLPGIATKLNNLLEFYTDTDYKVPADIN